MEKRVFLAAFVIIFIGFISTAFDGNYITGNQIITPGPPLLGPTPPTPTPPIFPVISYHASHPDYDLKVAKCGNFACSSGNTITTVDSASNVGLHTSLAIDGGGLPVISYQANNTNDVLVLRVVKCGNPACSSGNLFTDVDTTSGFVGAFTSIAIDGGGLPVISYYDQTKTKLKVAKCGNFACSSGNTITTVDNNGQVGTYTSIAIGSDGLPVISYYDQTNAELKVAKCGNPACSSGNTITTVDNNGQVGTYTSIAIGSDGLPVISYYDNTPNQPGSLKVAKCGNPACSSGNTITTVDNNDINGRFSSIAIGNGGLPIISYHGTIFFGNRSLMVAKCGNPACSSGNTITTVESGKRVGESTSIAVGSGGLPIISYYDASQSVRDLKAAKCGNFACSSGNTITTVDSTGSVGSYSSIA